MRPVRLLRPMREAGARTLTQGGGKRDGPRTSKGAGPLNRWGELLAQTAAGSSSTRRLRVRLESSGMPGPIVVLMAAFLM